MFSDAFMRRFASKVMKEVSRTNLVMTTYRYLTDSKFRVYQSLDAFLKRQVRVPDYELQKLLVYFQRLSQDDRVVEILRFCHSHIKYETDKVNFGKVEYWADAAQVWRNKKDDCDGVNSLIYVLARLSGIDPIKLWCCIGETVSGGHFWLLYFSTERDAWFSIDGTFFPSFVPISRREVFSFRKNDKYKDIWYLFNEDFTFKSKGII